MAGLNVSPEIESVVNVTKQFSALFLQDSKSSVFAGKVSAMLGVIAWKNSNKPLQPFNISQWTAKPSYREVFFILLVVTAVQLNMAEFCLSFKPVA